MGSKRKPIEPLLEFVHEYGLNPSTREIWIHGVDSHGKAYEEEPGVDYLMATRVIKNLHLLKHQSSRAGVTIHLHTCGGNVDEGFAIYDAIKSMPYPVTIIGYAHVRSMSSIIFLAGSKRLLHPSTYFMMHYGTVEIGGDAKTVYANISYNKTQDQSMLRIYAESIYSNSARWEFKGSEIKEIEEKLKWLMDERGDVFLTAKEAVYWGLAHSVLGG